jgi:hypothetical protein
VSKYEPLRKYLSGQDSQVDRLTMTFGAVEQLVGALPQSAYIHQAWWSNGSDTRVHTRAWRQPGWRVQSDQMEKRVVFIRDQGTADIGHAAEAPHVVPLETAATAESPPEKSDRKGPLLRWGAVCALTAAAIVAAGITGTAGVTHLPLPALAILTAAAGGVSFAISQAVASHKEVDSARKWWLTSTLLLIMALIGTFVYHIAFDPATRPPQTYQFVVINDESFFIPLYGEPDGPPQTLATGADGHNGLIGGQTYTFDCSATAENGTDWLRYERFGQTWWAPLSLLTPAVGNNEQISQC